MTAQQQHRPPLPTAPPVVAEAIPPYFTRRNQWVTWRYEHDGERPDKLKKMPYNPRSGHRARSNDSATWYTFRAAMQAYRSRGDSGVAYMLDGQPGQEGEVGIDLDGCRDPVTGAIAPWAQPWLERLIPCGYAEVSPSGGGVKMIIRGTIPKALKHTLDEHEGVEIYAWGRCFTMTGQRLPGSADEPLDAQEVLDELLATFGKPQPPQSPQSHRHQLPPARRSPATTGGRCAHGLLRLAPGSGSARGWSGCAPRWPRPPACATTSAWS